MRPRLLLLLAFAIVPLAALAEKAPPFDAEALLTQAAPFYDFDEAGMHPWHLKATYQFFTPDGGPADSGTFDYWWAAPHVDRSTWTRDAKTLSVWNTADKKHAILASDLVLGYEEQRLKSLLLAPLPSAEELNSDKVQIEARAVGKDTAPLRCAMLGPRMSETHHAPMGLFPTYCFDARLPVLLARYSFAAPVIEFEHIVKLQNRFLARQINIVAGTKKILSISVDGLYDISAEDSAFTPPPNAVIFDLPKGYRPVVVPGPDPKSKGNVPMPADITPGKVITRVQPVYPEGSKLIRDSGVVVLQAVIGTDGWVHGLEVQSAPSTLLAASALAAVSQWRYQPYLFKGQPVEVKTTINVIYSLSP